jgi:ABC-2 type transport system permease protein
MLAQILNLLNKELIHFRRDRLLTPFVLLGPVLQMVLLAGATAADISHLRLGVIDQDHSIASRRLVAAFANVKQFDPPLTLDSAERGKALLDAGELELVVCIPAGFGAGLWSGAEPPQVQLLIDGSNVIVGINVQSLAQGVLTRFQEQQVEEAGRSLPARGIEARPLIYYNPELNHRYSALPAQLGLIVYMVTMLVASFGIARERERGTMEQLRVTPLRRSELLIGKALPVLVISLTDFLIMFTLVVSLYHVPMRGSVLLLVGLTALYVLAEMGVGLTVSSVARSQQQSLLMVFLIGVLNVAFSGYIVPVKNMPWLLSQISNLFPVQHYMNIVRHVMLKGAGLWDMTYDVGALVVLGAVIMGMAYRLVQSRLD